MDAGRSTGEIGEKEKTFRATPQKEPEPPAEHTITVAAGRESYLVKARVAGESLELLVDTGATVSLLDYGLFCKRAGANLAQVEPSAARLRMANGAYMPNHGQVEVLVKMGALCLPITFILTTVGGIDGILGMDVLGTGVLDLPAAQLRLHNQRIPLWRRMVKACATVKSETLLAAGETTLVRTLTPPLKDLDWVFQPDQAWRDRETLICPVALVPNQMDPGVYVHNPNDGAVRVEAGALIGTWEGLADVTPEDGAGVVAGVTGEEGLGEVPPGSVPAHLADMVAPLAGLTAAQQAKLDALLVAYQDCFVGGAFGLGCTTMEVHEIPTPNSRPIKQPARIAAFKNRETVEELVRSQLDQGLIEPSTSPWSSPVVLVPKKDGTTRFCVDYRRLNEVTVKDAFPLPRIDIVVDYLAGSKYFCTLDAAQGYNQVEVKEEDRPKTAFTTGFQLYQYRMMPFGLTNAPATFQRLMHKVLVGLQPAECLAYLDDILIYGKDFDTTLLRLRHVLDRLRDAGLRLKPKKCVLFAKETEYLGHIVSAQGISTDPAKIEAVQDWPKPATVTEVRAFVGFCNYYRQYIARFAECAEPLIDLTRKGVPFEWCEAQDKAFEGLKQALCTSPTLAFPREDCEFVLDTDASDSAIGGVLSQIQEGEERPIAFASQCLSKTQRNYCTTKRELLAVVIFCQRWKHYLRHAQFLLRTDHGSLRWLTNFKECEGMLARWLLVLSGFHFRIEHRPGVKHVNADALSRLRKCPRTDCPTCGSSEGCAGELVATVEFEQLTRTKRELREAQEGDPDLALVLSWVKAGKRPPYSEALTSLGPVQMSYWKSFPTLYLRRGVLYRRGTVPPAGVVEQYCVPSSLRRELLMQLHSASTAGHMGVHRTVRRCRERFWWPYLHQDVEMWIAHCEPCARRSVKPPKQGLLQQEAVACPGERVAVDVAGPLPQSVRGNRFILVFTDYFTKWTEAVATPDHTAQTVARVFVDVWVSRFGCPLLLHSDQGREFESALFQALCERLRIGKTRTCPYNPRSNGQVERHNRTIGNMLCKVLETVNPNRWDEYLQEVMMAYRTSVHTTTGYTPAMMQLGRELVVPLDLIYGRPAVPDPARGPVCEGDFVEQLTDRLRRVYSRVRAELRRMAKASAVRHDKEVKVTAFRPGEWVWLYYLPYAHKKLQLKYVGPLQVVRSPFPNVYVVRHRTTGKCKAVHINYLKRAYVDEDKPQWMTTDFPDQEELDPLGVTDEGQTSDEIPDVPLPKAPAPAKSAPKGLGDPFAIFRPRVTRPAQELAEQAPLGPPVPTDSGYGDLLKPTTTRSGRRTKKPDRYGDLRLYPVSTD